LFTVPLIYVAAALVTWETRLSIIFIVPFTILSGLGIRRLLPAKSLYSEASLVAVLTVFFFMVANKPQEFYATVFTTDGPYSEIAAKLTAELKVGDIWVSWPFFRADDLYRYGSLPQPIRPRTDQEMLSFWRTRPTHRVCFIFTRSNPQNPIFLMTEKAANMQWRFANGLVLLRLPPRREPAVNGG
jgi:hypothetical protein